MKKNKHSLVYKNIFFYRLILNILYIGAYKKRYLSIIEKINVNKDKKIVELCFGDTIIADWCKKNNLSWAGIDINDNFILEAKKKKHIAEKKFINHNTYIERNDLLIIAGSLYHFNINIDAFLENILSSTRKLIILEPIFNLSNIKSLKFFLKSFSNINARQHNFRYTKEQLLQITSKLDSKIYNVEIFYPNWRDMLIIVNKNEI